MKNKDYTKYSFRITMLVIVIMLGISFIPPLSIGGITLRRANIISELYEFGDEHVSDKEAVINAADKEFLDEIAETGEVENADTTEIAENTSVVKPTTVDTWNIGGAATSSNSTPNTNKQIPAQEYKSVVPIEDFTEGTSVSVQEFCRRLEMESGKRVVRIAFLGDSFIEGDIITADVRTQLQSIYGGCGVGFVPFSTPLAPNRPTIKHTFTGWKSHNLIQKKSTPEHARERFFVSGNLSTSSVTASSTYQTTSFREHLNSVSSVRVLFTNTKESEVILTVNDTIERRFTPEPVDQVRQIHITGNGIKKLKTTVSAPDGFYGYGVVLEGTTGVTVDNYSIRSNSGLPMFGTNASINRQINRMLGYDMIVLQYGLNIMEADITSYTNYGIQFRKMVNYIKSCFPDALILIMGIGDRSTMRNGTAVTMPGVRGMLKEQRNAAIDCQVAFWNTFEAMGGQNSMARFVSWGWAAKDYTHLSFGGGRKIASEFVKAIEFARETGGIYPDDIILFDDSQSTYYYTPVERPDTLGNISITEQTEPENPEEQEALNLDVEKPTTVQDTTPLLPLPSPPKPLPSPKAPVENPLQPDNAPANELPPPAPEPDDNKRKNDQTKAEKAERKKAEKIERKEKKEAKKKKDKDTEEDTSSDEIVFDIPL